MKYPKTTGLYPKTTGLFPEGFPHENGDIPVTVKLVPLTGKLSMFAKIRGSKTSVKLRATVTRSYPRTLKQVQKISLATPLAHTRTVKIHTHG